MGLDVRHNGLPPDLLCAAVLRREICGPSIEALPIQNGNRVRAFTLAGMFHSYLPVGQGKLLKSLALHSRTPNGGRPPCVGKRLL